MPITRKDMQEAVALGPHALPPVVALGGADDGIVMEYQLRDAAEFFGAHAVVVPGVAHDLMLVRSFADFLGLLHHQYASVLAAWRPATAADLFLHLLRVLLCVLLGVHKPYIFLLQDTRWERAASILLEWVKGIEAKA